ncbi:hypothetical protein CC1G_08887 [Coprinopsis cinerea okayama7|uniref:Uncharacterized protein n=1 Tax=Coprinopsis cinerea (strain Okayama-7 / 130 / ATCC MYA-4618 / FGSC 9003) TaxID=240176 RepID=A8P865_COPC7|nr:hypothetical protein CC1G_08887 [Coprinopsis cinerea okayama7\|eukprot:XP_001839508.2 hypothetical protein CC1G_08887 [Coprinopsis cinerea okayama7\
MVGGAVVVRPKNGLRARPKRSRDGYDPVTTPDSQGILTGARRIKITGGTFISAGGNVSLAPESPHFEPPDVYEHYEEPPDWHSLAGPPPTRLIEGPVHTAPSESEWAVNSTARTQGPASSFPPAGMSRDTRAELEGLAEYTQESLEPLELIDTASAAAGSTLHLRLTKASFKHESGRKEGLIVSDTTLLVLLKSFPYVIHLVGISAKTSPTKFTVYSDPSPSTYNNYKLGLRGVGYREFDARYETTFTLGLNYLKADGLTGLALEQIFTETRLVKSTGDAFIVVPSPFDSQASKAQAAIKIIKLVHAMIKRRVDVTPKIVRCPACLPEVFGFYGGLARAANRVIRNLESSGLNLDTLADAKAEAGGPAEWHEVMSVLRNAERLMTSLATDVLQRSRECKGGVCGWCGGRWSENEKEEGRAFIEPVGTEPGPEVVTSSSFIFRWGMILVLCIFLSFVGILFRGFYYS